MHGCTRKPTKPTGIPERPMIYITQAQPRALATGGLGELGLLARTKLLLASASSNPCRAFYDATVYGSPEVDPAVVVERNSPGAPPRGCATAGACAVVSKSYAATGEVSLPVWVCAVALCISCGSCVCQLLIQFPACLVKSPSIIC